MDYFEKYITSVIEDKNFNRLDHLRMFFESNNINLYDDRAKWLNKHYDFLKLDNVEFGAELLFYTLESWNEIISLDIALGIDFDDIDDIEKNRDILLEYEKYNVELPDETIKLLEVSEILNDFKNNYKKINKDNITGFDKDKLKKLIYDKKYDVYDVDQVEALAELVYYNFSDEQSIFKTEHLFTRLMNQIALNAQLDKKVLEAAERGAAGWYADNIEAQLEKVDMEDFRNEIKKNELEEKRKYLITPELVRKLQDEYKDILNISYREGFIGLEDQRNDYISVTFNGEVIYKDDGFGNEFGDIRLNGKKLFKVLEKFKEVPKIFLP